MHFPSLHARSNFASINDALSLYSMKIIRVNHVIKFSQNGACFSHRHLNIYLYIVSIDKIFLYFVFHLLTIYLTMAYHFPIIVSPMYQMFSVLRSCIHENHNEDPIPAARPPHDSTPPAAADRSSLRRRKRRNRSALSRRSIPCIWRPSTSRMEWTALRSPT